MRTKTVEKRWFQKTKMCKRVGNRAEKWHNHDIHMSFGMCSIICFMLLFAGIGTASATDYYYVAPWGNDSHPGNMTHPWQHPSYAAQQAHAGDTIYLMDGTWYGETIEFTNSGTADNPIVMKAYNRRQAILDGQNKTNKWYYGLKFPSHSPREHINISRLVIKDYGSGISLGGCNNIHIDDCEISDGVGWGIALWDGTNNCSITNCDLHDFGDNTINLESSSKGIDNISIMNNKIHDNPGTSGASGHNMINLAVTGLMTHIDIIGNEIYNKTVNGAPFYVIGGPNSGHPPARFVTIRGNILHDNYYGVTLYALDDSEMSNNVVYNHLYQGIRVFAPLNVSVKNNIVTNCSTGIWRSQNQGNVTLSYNNFWNNGEDHSRIDPGETDISADPLFADPVNHDFHLKSTGERWNDATWVTDNVKSPCIDAGDPNDECTNEYPPINMGAYGDTIEASLSGEITPIPGDVYIWLEAESAATLTPDFELANDASASNSEYIWVPEGTGWSPRTGEATYTIHVNTSGDYAIWGTTLAPTDGNNSFFVQMDEGFEALWAISLSENWHWDAVNHWGNGTEFDPEIDPVVFTLSAGVHTLKIKQREDGTKLDRLLITNNMSYVPAEIESTNALSGTVTSPRGTYIANATVTLTTRAGAEINTTQTDSTGHYAFADVSPDYYDINATKRSYWSNTNNVTVTAEAPETADIVLCQKGDFNTNSEPADAGDLAMMADATKTGTSDETYDLDGDGYMADAADLTLLKNVSVGVAELE